MLEMFNKLIPAMLCAVAGTAIEVCAFAAVKLPWNGADRIMMIVSGLIALGVGYTYVRDSSLRRSHWDYLAPGFASIAGVGALVLAIW